MNVRTDAEIIAQIKAVASDDWMGTQTNGLVSYLTFSAAKNLKLLKPEATEDEWGEVTPRDSESVTAEILKYMPFAWDKANNCRGISAGRSLNHMKVWLWMLLNEEATEFLSGYDCYGKPQLRAICEAFGWDWTQWDNQQWGDNEEGPFSSPPTDVLPLPLPTPPETTS